MNRYIVCLFPSFLFWLTPIVTVLPVLEARPVTVAPASSTHDDEYTSVSPDDSYWTESGMAWATALYEAHYDEGPDNATIGTPPVTFMEPGTWSLRGVAIRSTVTGILALVGTIGNGLVILAFCTYRQVRTSAHAFILSISISDILMTGFHYPTAIANMILGAPALGDAFCPIQGAFFCFSIYVSFLSMILIAFNKCMHITKSTAKDACERSGCLDAAGYITAFINTTQPPWRSRWWD